MKVTTVLLDCELGEHTWERPSQRGRLPKNCPDHTPVAPPRVYAPRPEKTPKTLVSLTCSQGHTWERLNKPGRTPRWCHEHSPVVAPKEPTEVTMVCAHDGHTYLRTSKKGRAPKWCPLHKIVKEPKVKVRTFRGSDTVMPVLSGEARTDHLMFMLRSRGTLASQNA